MNIFVYSRLPWWWNLIGVGGGQASLTFEIVFSDGSTWVTDTGDTVVGVTP
jgi:hypothetical protein